MLPLDVLSPEAQRTEADRTEISFTVHFPIHGELHVVDTSHPGQAEVVKKAARELYSKGALHHAEQLAEPGASQSRFAGVRLLEARVAGITETPEVPLLGLHRQYRYFIVYRGMILAFPN